jgi:hypothetical protein
VKQNQTCWEVCTVEIGDDHSLTEPISFEGGADELREFFRSGPDVNETWLCEPRNDGGMPFSKTLARSPRRAAPSQS